DTATDGEIFHHITSVQDRSGQTGAEILRITYMEHWVGDHPLYWPLIDTIAYFHSIARVRWLHGNRDSHVGAHFPHHTRSARTWLKPQGHAILLETHHSLTPCITSSKLLLSRFLGAEFLFLSFFNRSFSQPHHSLGNVYQKPDLLDNLKSHILFLLN